jgi:branched-chain amino acid transport system permease protein
LEGPKQEIVRFGGATFLNIDVWSVASAVTLVVLLSAVVRWTDLGRQIKATRANPELAEIIGINAHRIYLLVFATGTFLAGTAAFWYSLKFQLDPAMGLRPIIFSFVVAFLAGMASSPIRVFLTGTGVGLLEKYFSIWLSTRWTETAVFVVLFIYLVVRAVEPRRIILSRFPELHRVRA